MNLELHQMASIAREQADTARCLTTLCRDMTDALDTIVDAILRDANQPPMSKTGEDHDRKATRSPCTRS